jgi:membrane protease YdiL (CAAX protease family)
MTIIEETLPTEDYQPPRWAFWAMVVILLFAYLGFQLLFVLPVVIQQAELGIVQTQEDLLNSEPFLRAGLIGAGAASLVVVLIVWLWPTVWSRITSTGPVDWIGWRAPRHLKFWHIALITLAFLIIISIVIEQLFGNPEVELQTQLFSSPVLQMIAVPVVSLIVPFAEEFIFRGALYKALLPPGAEDSDKDVTQSWRDHLLPFLVTGIVFAALHLTAGFESAASIVMVTLLSLMLSGFRAVTGSVQASIAGHMAWNFIAAVGLVLVNLVDL